MFRRAKITPAAAIRRLNLRSSQFSITNSLLHETKRQLSSKKPTNLYDTYEKLSEQVSDFFLRPTPWQIDFRQFNKFLNELNQLYSYERIKFIKCLAPKRSSKDT